MLVYLLIHFTCCALVFLWLDLRFSRGILGFVQALVDEEFPFPTDPIDDAERAVLFTLWLLVLGTPLWVLLQLWTETKVLWQYAHLCVEVARIRLRLWRRGWRKDWVKPWTIADEWSRQVRLYRARKFLTRRAWAPRWYLRD